MCVDCGDVWACLKLLCLGMPPPPPPSQCNGQHVVHSTWLPITPTPPSPHPPPSYHHPHHSHSWYGFSPVLTHTTWKHIAIMLTSTHWGNTKLHNYNQAMCQYNWLIPCTMCARFIAHCWTLVQKHCIRYVEVSQTSAISLPPNHLFDQFVTCITGSGSHSGQGTSKTLLEC